VIVFRTVKRLAPAVLLLLACAKNHAGVNEATVEQVSTWMKQGTATVFDANNDAFRQNNGAVQGAVLLPSYKDYDVKLLGDDKDRQLVFYCSNRL
jgi:rhodanese-related sulfurtransferase